MIDGKLVSVQAWFNFSDCQVALAENGMVISKKNDGNMNHRMRRKDIAEKIKFKETYKLTVRLAGGLTKRITLRL